MHAVIGANSLLETGDRAVAGAVMPRAAVAATASVAAAICFIMRVFIVETLRLRVKSLCSLYAS